MAPVTTSADAAPPRLMTGTRLGVPVVLAEIGLTLLEALLVFAPAFALAGQSILASGVLPQFLPLLSLIHI